MALVPVHMPKYGMTMEVGIVVEWLKQDGEDIAEGESLAVIETEKVETELEAPASGKVQEILAELDEEVPVGEVIAYIEDGK
jgi:pyruvate dehydrogenase E2 component (dihydrolipoamide acetyltransferase)